MRTQTRSQTQTQTQSQTQSQNETHAETRSKIVIGDQRAGRPQPRVRWALLCCLSLLLMPWLAAADPGVDRDVDRGADQVRASLDRPSVYAGDRVTLTIERAGTGNTMAPDWSPLAADFEVGGTSVSTDIRIVNGQRTDRTRFSVALTPRRSGTIEVPALRVGSAVTEPLTLDVKPVPTGAVGGPGDPVFVEVTIDADPAALVVNQQVPVSVRAYSAAPLLDYGLRLPGIDGAVLTQLGRETGRMTSRNGEPHRVIEWRFSLSPERSGELVIPPLVVDARIEPRPDPGSISPAREPFGGHLQDPMLERMLGANPLARGLFSFDRGEPVRAQSQPLVLTVAATPAGFGDRPWLPARDVRISDDWQAAPPSLAVGEPVERTLTITATGLTGNQLPTLDLPLPDSVRAYPGRNEVETESDGALVYGSSRQSLTLIPQQGGRLDLPELRLPWWDTETQQRREAVLPGMTLMVAGPVAGSNAIADANARLEATPGTGADHATTAPANGGSPPAATGQGDRTGVIAADGLDTAGDGWRWGWMLALGTALVVISAALLWGRYRKLAGARPPPKPTASGGAVAAGVASSLGLHAQRERLQAACETNEPGAAAKALLAWAQARWPDDPPTNLAALAARVAATSDARAAPAAAAIGALERHLYAPRTHSGGDNEAGAATWDGAPLWSALQDVIEIIPAIGPTDRDAGDLAPLYPQRA